MTYSAHDVVADTSFISAWSEFAGKRRLADVWPQTVTSSIAIAAIAISIVTLAEVRFGHKLARWGERRRRHAERWLGQFTRIPVDEGVADAWVRLKVAAQRNGRMFSANDLWIAATARFHRVPVITCDRDFLPMRDLGVEVMYLPRRPVVT